MTTLKNCRREAPAWSVVGLRRSWALLWALLTLRRWSAVSDTCPRSCRQSAGRLTGCRPESRRSGRPSWWPARWTSADSAAEWERSPGWRDRWTWQYTCRGTATCGRSSWEPRDSRPRALSDLSAAQPDNKVVTMVQRVFLPPKTTKHVRLGRTCTRLFFPGELKGWVDLNEWLYTEIVYAVS